MGSALDLAAKADDLLRRHGLATRRSFGQNFLVRRSVLTHEVRELDAEDRTVLEVGTGFGFLTRELAAVARNVTTLEKDRGIARVAREELADLDNVEVVEADALSNDLPSAERVISNVPYSISSPLVFRLIAACRVPIVLVLQREFALRMVAEPGSREYSRLSVMVQHYADPELLFPVHRSAFHPRPRVDSMALRLIPRGVTRDHVLDEVVRALFQHRNQTVRNAMLHGRHILAVEKHDGARIKDALGLLANERVRNVPVAVFSELAQRLAEAGMGPRDGNA